MRRRLAIAPRPRRERGFTLVELLIALSLMGLITLLLFSGLRLGTRASEGVAAGAERMAPLRLAHNFIARTLAQARPVQVVVDDGESRLLFSGDAQTIELTSPLGQHVGIPGLYVLRLVLDESDGRRLLLIRWLLHEDVLAGADDVPPWQLLKEGGAGPAGALDQDLAAGAFGTNLLLDGVDAFEIAYFGTIDDAEPEWHPEWIDQTTVPIAVRVRLTTLDQTWPDTLIPLAEVR